MGMFKMFQMRIREAVKADPVYSQIAGGLSLLGSRDKYARWAAMFNIIYNANVPQLKDPQIELLSNGVSITVDGIFSRPYVNTNRSHILSASDLHVTTLTDYHEFLRSQFKREDFRKGLSLHRAEMMIEVEINRIKITDHVCKKAILRMGDLIQNDHELAIEFDRYKMEAVRSQLRGRVQLNKLNVSMSSYVYELSASVKEGVRASLPAVIPLILDGRDLGSLLIMVNGRLKQGVVQVHAAAATTIVPSVSRERATHADRVAVNNWSSIINYENVIRLRFNIGGRKHDFSSLYDSFNLIRLSGFSMETCINLARENPDWSRPVITYFLALINTIGQITPAEMLNILDEQPFYFEMNEYVRPRPHKGWDKSVIDGWLLFLACGLFYILSPEPTLSTQHICVSRDISEMVKMPPRLGDLTIFSPINDMFLYAFRHDHDGVLEPILTKNRYRRTEYGWLFGETIRTLDTPKMRQVLYYNFGTFPTMVDVLNIVMRIFRGHHELTDDTIGRIEVLCFVFQYDCYVITKKGIISRPNIRSSFYNIHNGTGRMSLNNLPSLIYHSYFTAMCDEILIPTQVAI
jgi:hypothetical protein